MRTVFNTNEDVIRAWLEGNEQARNRQGSLHAIGNILKTYNEILAIRIEDTILINGDQYSPTSNRHRYLVQRLAVNAVTVSYSAVLNIIAMFALGDYLGTESRLKELVVIDKTKAKELGEEYRLIGEQYKEYPPIDPDNPKEFTTEEFERYVRYLRTKYSEVRVFTFKNGDKRVYAHTAETVLLSYHGLHILAGFDDQSYFACALPEPTNTVEEAFEVLKPKTVVKAMAEGKEVLRQGEWFFIKVADSPKEIGLRDKDFRVKSLPRLRGQNPHKCRIAIKDGKIYCTGLVRHGAREHTPVKLEGIYTPVRNNEIVSATSNYRVD